MSNRNRSGKQEHGHRVYPGRVLLQTLHPVHSGPPQYSIIPTLQYSAPDRVRGFSVIEVLAAVFILGLAFTPLLVQVGEARKEAVRSRLLQQATRIAETMLHEIHVRGYAWYESGSWQLEEEDAFTARAVFTAEEISVTGLLAPPTEDEETGTVNEEEEENKDDMIVIYHITVTVASRADPDINVELTLDLPAGSRGLSGVEELVPVVAEEAPL